MKRSVTIEQVVCDLCDSVIGPHNDSGAGRSHDMKIMKKKLCVRLVVVQGHDDAEDRPLDLCENCLREVLKSAGVT